MGIFFFHRLSYKTTIISENLDKMVKSASWELKYQFGFDDDIIKEIRKAAEENAGNDIKEYVYEHGHILVQNLIHLSGHL